MKKIILNPGGSPNERGLFSFVIQYLSAHRHYLDNPSVIIDFDLNQKSAYFDSGIEFTNNVWNYFFNSLDSSENITSEENIVWTEIGNFYGYSFNFKDEKEREISSKIISEKLILREEIVEEINCFFEKNLKDKKILGVHKRGTDIGYHHQAKSLGEYFSEIDAIKDNFDVIFLSTDERIVVDEFEKKYSNVLNYSYDSLSVSKDKPNFKAKTMGGYKTGKDAVLDAYILSKCDFLIQTNSNLSNFSLLVNPNLNFKRI